VVDRGYSVSDVAKRLGVSVQSLYKWVKEYSPNAVDQYEAELKDVRRENLRLKTELRRAQEERECCADGLNSQLCSLQKIRNEILLYFAVS